jgi:membrane protein
MKKQIYFFHKFKISLLEKIIFYTFPIWVFRIGDLKIFEIPLVFFLFVYAIYNFSFIVKKNFINLIIMVLFLTVYYLYGIVVLSGFENIEWAIGSKSFYIYNLLYYLQCVIIVSFLYIMGSIGSTINKIDIIFMFFINLVLLFLLNINEKSALFPEKGLLGGYLAILSIFLIEIRKSYEKVYISYIFLFISIVVCLLVESTRGILFVLGYIVSVIISKYANIKSTFFIGIILMCILYIMVQFNIANVYTKFALVSDILFGTDYSPYKDQVEQHSVGRYAALFMMSRIFNYDFDFGVGLGNYVYFRELYSEGLPANFHDYAGLLFVNNIVEFGMIGCIVWYFLFFKIFSSSFKNRDKIKIILFSLIFSFLANPNDYYSFLLLAFFIGVCLNKTKRQALYVM